MDDLLRKNLHTFRVDEDSLIEDIHTQDQQRLQMQMKEWTAARVSSISTAIATTDHLQAIACVVKFSNQFSCSDSAAELLSLALYYFHRLLDEEVTDDPISIAGLLLMSWLIASKQRGGSSFCLTDVAIFLCSQFDATAATHVSFCVLQDDFWAMCVNPLRHQGRATTNAKKQFCWSSDLPLPRELRSVLQAQRFDGGATFQYPHYVLAMLADWEVSLLLQLDYQLDRLTPFDVAVAVVEDVEEKFQLARDALQQQLLGDVPYHENLWEWMVQRRCSVYTPDKAGTMVWNILTAEMATK